MYSPYCSCKLTSGYTFQLYAAVAGNAEQSTTALAHVRATFSTLVSMIANGDRAVAADMPLVVDGSGSFDPDRTRSPFSYEWGCSIQVGLPRPTAATPVENPCRSCKLT